MSFSFIWCLKFDGQILVHYLVYQDLNPWPLSQQFSALSLVYQNCCTSGLVKNWSVNTLYARRCVLLWCAVCMLYFWNCLLSVYCCLWNKLYVQCKHVCRWSKHFNKDILCHHRHRYIMLPLTRLTWVSTRAWPGTFCQNFLHPHQNGKEMWLGRIIINNTECQHHSFWLVIEAKYLHWMYFLS